MANSLIIIIDFPEKKLIVYRKTFFGKSKSAALSLFSPTYSGETLGTSIKLKSSTRIYLVENIQRNPYKRSLVEPHS